MEVTCKNCGCKIKVNGLGRKKRKYPVQIVLNEYQAQQNIGIVSEKTGVSKGTIHRILKRHGVDTRRKTKNAMA